MTTMQVAATTITNISGTSRKFYTIHVLDNVEIRQYGRIGTQGQFKHIHHSGKRAAEASAESQLNAKERKGYGNRQNVIYALDDKFLRYDEDDLSKIAHQAHLAAQQGEYSEGDLRHDRSWEAPTSIDRIDPSWERSANNPIEVAFDSFNERALNVISSAATGGAEAATTYAQLREEFDGMEQGYERCQSLLETLEIMLTSGGDS